MRNNETKTIKRFIFDKPEAVNRAIKNYEKKWKIVIADVGLMSTRRVYELDRETYTEEDGYNVTFMLGNKKWKQNVKNAEMNGKQTLKWLWLVVQVVVLKLKLGRCQMKTHKEFIKEVEKASSLKEQTKDAFCEVKDDTK